ncbi:MAG: NADH-quinone oxidoreductase subunit NuoH [Anaerolineae bacterium]|nr:NADH-quinone oxidoreductase subunit NuoH [Anaerolineae bacterium]
MNSFDFLANLFVNLAEWITGYLLLWGFSSVFANLIVRILGALAMAIFPIAAVVFLIWEARKVIARIQDRMGPTSDGTYAGPFALLQTFADVIKIFTKELIIPEGVDKGIFIIAPVIVIAVAVSNWAVIPLGPEGMQVVDLDLGVFYIIAMSSFTPFSMILAGWSSRNKYADVGAFRAVSQIISYEVPLVLAVLIPCMLTGSMSLQDIIQEQHVPFILIIPVTALIYFLASTAEIGRLPFELAEADSEIVSGYSTEYSGMLFGSFYLAEFINNFTASVVFTIVFLGGWRGPGVATYPILGLFWILLKAFIVFNIFMLFWAAMPRLRIDQVLSFNWKFMVPLALCNLVLVACVDKLLAFYINPMWWQRAVALSALNLVMILALIGFLQIVGLRMKKSKSQAGFSST